MTPRPLGPGDRAAAVALWQRCGLTRPWNDPGADFDRALAAEGSALLGVDDQAGGMLATVMVGDDGHRGWLYYLAVAPDHRGRGMGRLLVAAAEDWLRERGVPKVHLMVRDGNDAAAFYHRLGYERADVVVMARWL